MGVGKAHDLNQSYSIKLRPKIKRCFFIAFAVEVVAHAVVGAGDYQKALGGRAAFVIFVGHFHGDEAVIGAVDKEDGDIGLSEGVGSGEIPRAGVDLLFAEVVGGASVKTVGNVEIIFNHVLPDGVRGRKSTVGDDPVDILRHGQSRCHEDGGGAHRDPPQINGERVLATLIHPLHPIAAVVAFQPNTTRRIPP